MNKNILFTLIIVLISFAGLNKLEANDSKPCSINSKVLGLKYSITETKPTSHETNTNNSNQNDSRVEQLNLWRNNKTVAQENLTTGITDQWYRLPNQAIIPTRHFDHYQRSIEYQASDLKTEQSDTAWDAKYQIISSNTLNKMTLKSTNGIGCDKIETYELITENTRTVIEWLPGIKAVKSLQKASEHSTIEWRLEQTVTDSSEIKNKFTHWLNYQATDFADIGDNESDPFFQKMIKMGFIQHAHSGNDRHSH